MPTAARPAASWAAQDCCARGWVPSASCTLYCSACCNRMLCGGGPARINPWDLLCPLRRFLPLLSLQVSSCPPAKPPSPCFRAWRAPAVVSAQVIHRYQISRNVPQQGHVVVYCVQNRRNCLPGGTRQLAQRWLQSPHAQVAIAMHCPAASIHVSKPLPLSWSSAALIPSFPPFPPQTPHNCVSPPHSQLIDTCATPFRAPDPAIMLTDTMMPLCRIVPASYQEYPKYMPGICSSTPDLFNAASSANLLLLLPL